MNVAVDPWSQVLMARPADLPLQGGLLPTWLLFTHSEWPRRGGGLRVTPPGGISERVHDRSLAFTSNSATCPTGLIWI